MPITAIDLSLQIFLDWVKEGRWASPATASREFWAAHFGRLQHVIKTYNEGMEKPNVEISSAVLEDLVRQQTFDDLLTWQIERNPDWSSSSNPNQSKMSLQIRAHAQSHVFDFS